MIGAPASQNPGRAAGSVKYRNLKFPNIIASLERFDEMPTPARDQTTCWSLK